MSGRSKGRVPETSHVYVPSGGPDQRQIVTFEGFAAHATHLGSRGKCVFVRPCRPSPPLPVFCRRPSATRITNASERHVTHQVRETSMPHMKQIYLALSWCTDPWILDSSPRLLKRACPTPLAGGSGTFTCAWEGH